MNRGWEDAKKGSQGSKPTHNERPTSGSTPPNAWFAQRQNPNLRILKRDPQAPPSSKPQPKLDDKSLWPTLGVSGIIIYKWISRSNHCLHCYIYSFRIGFHFN